MEKLDDKTLEKLTGIDPRLWKIVSADSLMLIRNSAFGGAAVSLAILISIVQIGAESTPLKICTYASVVALPFWILVAMMYEYYFLMGEKSYGHLQKGATYLAAAGLFAVAALGLYVAVCAVIYYLVPAALWVFLGASLIAGLVSSSHQKIVLRYIDDTSKANQ